MNGKEKLWLGMSLFSCMAAILNAIMQEKLFCSIAVLLTAISIILFVHTK